MEKMQKLNFPGTHWRGLALIGAQKNPAWRADLFQLVLFKYFLRDGKHLNDSLGSLSNKQPKQLIDDLTIEDRTKTQ